LDYGPGPPACCIRRGRRQRLKPSWRLYEEVMRDVIKLTCANCSRANYHTTKNKRTMTEKFAIKKFCPSCRKHFEHKEGKISRG
jgi:large subunit ribosomal protein L33